MISDNQILHVKNSWQLISPSLQQMGQVFYNRLFETNPELKPLFKSDPKDQAMKFMFMLSYLVHRLDKKFELHEELKKLAARHHSYHVKPEHYEIIGNTLFWTLENQLGNKWDKETASAWRMTYRMFALIMQEH